MKETKAKSKSKQNSPWYKDGIQFQCQGSGKCCTSHGEHGSVFLSAADLKTFVSYFKTTPKKFKQIYCEPQQRDDDVVRLKDAEGTEDCIFLKNKKCSVYEARPTQCRTWPFWPDHMSPKKWKKTVVDFCPGVNKGKVFTLPEIQKNLDEQAAVDAELT